MRNTFLVLSVLFGLAFGGNWTFSQLRKSPKVINRDVDGGEGEFTSACVLKGYYQFSGKTPEGYKFSCDGPYSSTSLELIVHFYAQKGNCYADFIFASLPEGWCDNGVVGDTPVGGIEQEFHGKGLRFTVYALSQSRPYLTFESACCYNNGVDLEGVPVEDINTDAFATCPGSDYSGCIGDEMR